MRLVKKLRSLRVKLPLQMTKYYPSARRKARRYAVQALYQWSFTQAYVGELEAQYVSEMNPKKVDVEYFKVLINGVILQKDKLDQHVVQYTDRTATEVSPIEMAILRIAVFELQNRLDVPYKVVINEALELTKIFGAEEGFKFVNGILDKVAAEVRGDLG